MDEEQKRATANDLRITSETMGFVEFDPEPRPPGEPRVELALSLAMMERHTWCGIGGRSARSRRPRRMSRDTSLALDVTSSSGGGGGSGGGGPDYLRSGDDCRRLIGRAIKRSLREEEEYRRLSPAQWDKAVPQDVVERALAVAGGGGTCVARVDICIDFEFVYSEPKALKRACFENGRSGGDPTGRSGGGGDGGAPWCSICFEEMSRDACEVTDLPGCTHCFHTSCIGKWFEKASTCPVCRRDQLRYLPPDYRHLHDKMTTDRDN